MRLVVEFGASKTVCLLAGPDGGLRGAGVEPHWAPGDPAAADRSLKLALAAAEAAGGRAPAIADVVLDTPDLALVEVSGVARCGGTVESGTVRRALQAALAALPGGRAALHVFPHGYRLDDGPALADPRGRQARAVTAVAQVVAAPADALLAARDRLAEAGLHLGRAIAAPYAAGLAALTARERHDGVILIDLGAARTGVAAFHAGAPVFLQVAPLGQSAVTRALAERLGGAEAAAEHVKTRRLSLAPEGHGGGPIEVARLGPDGRLEPQVIAPAALAEAAGAAVDAIFAATAAALAGARLPPGAERWPAALTGGGARLPGLEPFAAAALARAVRVAIPAADGPLADPALAAAAGALAWRRGGEPGEAPAPAPRLRVDPPRPQGGVTVGAAAALRWLRDNF